MDNTGTRTYTFDGDGFFYGAFYFNNLVMTNDGNGRLVAAGYVYPRCYIYDKNGNVRHTVFGDGSSIISSASGETKTEKYFLPVEAGDYITLSATYFDMSSYNQIWQYWARTWEASFIKVTY